MKTAYTILLTLFSCLFCLAQTTNNKLLETKLDSAFAKLFKADAPGGSVFIQQGEKILYKKSFGLADLKTKEKFTSATVANLGSISKTFVAYGILILQNQGKLSVEDSIIKFFPEFKNKALAQKIKIKHLLTHTSGLPDCRHVEKDSIFYLTAKDAENFKPLTLTDTLEFEPGSQWNYSNPAYNGLALIIEQVSKMKWQEFIIKNIFNPSGMKSSKITDGSYPDKGVAHSYVLRNNVYEEFDYGEYPTFTAAGNGGVWSSVEDLRLYIKAINACKFTDCKTIQLSETAYHFDNWTMKEELPHALVWFVHPSFFDSYHKQEQCHVIEHNGDQAGFKAHVIMIPENDMKIIWITNNDEFITNPIRKILLSLHYIK
jgi:CubicO group peptidase (beta-lactamase class C family)